MSFQCQGDLIAAKDVHLLSVGRWESWTFALCPQNISCGMERKEHGPWRRVPLIERGYGRYVEIDSELGVDLVSDVDVVLGNKI